VVVDAQALGALSTLVARRFATEFVAILLVAAITGRFALVPTAGDWFAIVAGQAGTSGDTIFNLALCVGATGRWAAKFFYKMYMKL
jgi:hypothetical protein